MSEVELLRREVIEDAPVVEKIGSRFYPGELATVSRPKYPCANFSFTGGVPDADIKDIGMKTFKIWAWAKGDQGGYDKTREIHKAIRDVIDNKRFADTDCYVVFKMTGEPLDYYEAIDGIYATTGVFRVRVIQTSG
ncbi:hypothetical protein ES703_88538 [subsurface metagenome]